MFGLLVLNATARLIDVTVSGTLPEPATGEFGDGVAVLDTIDAPQLLIERSYVGRSARAGIANFSGSVQLLGVALECNPFDIDAETVQGPHAFPDSRGTACYCDEVSRDCVAVSNGLAPPPSSP